MSTILDFRTDLTNALKAIPALAAETFVESYVPELERRNLANREIHITIETRSTEMISRGCKQTTVTAIVAILVPLIKGQENSQAEAIHTLVDTIHDSLLGNKVGGTTNANCTKIEHVVYDPENDKLFRAGSTFIRVTLVK